jgi:hypothetical protein
VQVSAKYEGLRNTSRSALQPDDLFEGRRSRKTLLQEHYQRMRYAISTSTLQVL